MPPILSKLKLKPGEVKMFLVFADVHRSTLDVKGILNLQTPIQEHVSDQDLQVDLIKNATVGGTIDYNGPVVVNLYKTTIERRGHRKYGTYTCDERLMPKDDATTVGQYLSQQFKDFKRFLDEVDKKEPDHELTALENQLDLIGRYDKVAKKTRKSVVKYYVRLESKAIQKKEVEKLGVNLHELKDDLLFFALFRKLAGVNSSYVYVAGQSSITPLHFEDIGGVNSFNLLMGANTKKIWLTIPPSQNKKLFEAFRKVFPGGCKNPFSCKNHFITRKGLKQFGVDYDLTIQNSGDLIITASQGLHQVTSFTDGAETLNVARATNMVCLDCLDKIETFDPEWLCKCPSDNVDEAAGLAEKAELNSNFEDVKRAAKALKIDMVKGQRLALQMPEITKRFPEYFNGMQCQTKEGETVRRTPAGVFVLKRNKIAAYQRNSVETLANLPRGCDLNATTIVKNLKKLRGFPEFESRSHYYANLVKRFGDDSQKLDFVSQLAKLGPASALLVILSDWLQSKIPDIPQQDMLTLFRVAAMDNKAYFELMARKYPESFAQFLVNFEKLVVTDPDPDFEVLLDSLKAELLTMDQFIAVQTAIMNDDSAIDVAPDFEDSDNSSSESDGSESEENPETKESAHGNKKMKLDHELKKQRTTWYRKENGVYVCSWEGCDHSSFSRSHNLYDHYKDVHLETRSLQTCQMCGKTFTLQRNLLQHLQTVCNVARSACGLCGRVVKNVRKHQQRSCKEVKD